MIESKKSLTTKSVVKIVSDWMKTDNYVSGGGDYKENEYKTFIYQNQTYRYLAKDIDTKKELLKKLTTSVTTDYAEQYLESKRIIVHKGKLAQIEADGGSLLQWSKAKATYDSTKENQRIYTITVPVGETEQVEQYQVSFKYVKNRGWKISSGPTLHVNLDIPFNINPAFIFFKYLLVDAKESTSQFSSPDILNVEEFKRGITRLEVRTLNEWTRNERQVEFAATFDVEVEPNYKGSLNHGLNSLYFLIENTGEMEFSIVSISTKPHLLQN
nr:DL-endopeptidase inhibitor IseA family protein [Metabacillus litoralis]